MKFIKKDSNSEQHKLSKKDIAIVILSTLLLVLLLLIVLLSRRRDQMISESLQKNSSMVTDDTIASINSTTMDNLEITEINSDKWIEIHNNSSKTIDISGLEFGISGKQGTIVEDKTVIKKDGYYVVELDANPGASNENVLTITDADGEVVKTFLVPKLEDEKSYGLVDAENNIWGYMKPTKGKQNKTKDIQYVDYNGIAMSAPGGFYDSGFGLELQCDEGEKIYYTTDGSKPTTESTEYESPISIVNKSGSKYVYAREAIYNRFSSGYMPGTVDAGMIIRAIKVNASGSVTGEISQAYYVGLTKDSDYIDLPVISITTDPENLFDYANGIYTAGKTREDALIQGLNGDYYANYYNAWKKASKIEYYEPTKDKSFEIMADINIDADVHVAARQKSFTITIDNEDYKKYSGSSIQDFISSEGQISLSTNQKDNDIKVRNLMADSLAEETDIGVIRYQPCVLFLDGEYWGLYTLRTHLDEKYIGQKYDVANEELIIRNDGDNENNFNSFYYFVTYNDMSVKANYDQVKGLMDIDNFIDYVCFNVFLGNASFSPAKGTAWRTVRTDGTGKADGKWRFLCGDLSETMYMSNLQTPTINTFLQRGMQGDLLFQSLLMNDEFCKQLESRMNKLIKENFDYEVCNEKLESIDNLIRKPAMASYSRFFGNLSDKEYSMRIEDIQVFLEERPEYIAAYAKELAEAGGNLAKAKEIIAEMEEEKAKEEKAKEERAKEEGKVTDSEEDITNEEGLTEEQEAAEDITAETGNNVTRDNAGEAVEKTAPEEKVIEEKIEQEPEDQELKAEEITDSGN
ncbi:CotH kinase family protein [Butyrivibrio sp. VCD2006]|uniref:CotH kinase family protein n=1 Tax=Butyrivibrio sp. VCD2006 TaxID=1280664 RepID=UPI00041C2C4E|nr:CotH kinase family protein [Butyrivibrio sp. VCD2006]